jgi:hypothetical protein
MSCETPNGRVHHVNSDCHMLPSFGWKYMMCVAQSERADVDARDVLDVASSILGAPIVL